MRNKLILAIIATIGLSNVVLSQSPKSPTGIAKDETENISPADKGNIKKSVFLQDSHHIGLLAPEVTTITFDDIIFTTDNSIPISANRYAGVSFYGAGTQTWLTSFRSLSYPNSLIIGYNNFGNIYSINNLVVDFTQPAKDVFFWWGLDGTYTSGTIEIYNENLQLVNSIPVNLFGSWVSFSLNQFHQRIKRIILRRPNVFDNLYGHIFLENFQFTPITTRSPVGSLESVSISDAAAIGWSADPDNPSANNFVDCYIDGQILSRVTANLPGAGAPYPGNHRFSVPIPAAYRDGNNHQINCHGIDIAGGDPSALLTGSPKTFNIPRNVTSVTFQQIQPSSVPINDNPEVLPHNPGIGLRIFPDDDVPQDGVDRRRIRVTATLSQPIPNVLVYFRNFDLDDPASDTTIDPNGNAGDDNNGTPMAGTLGVCTATSNGCSASTNASGVAIVEFTVTRQPGDNFAIAAGVIPAEVGAVTMNGFELTNGGGQNLVTNCSTQPVCRSEMLTVWRRLHIEVDSMGQSQQNFRVGNFGETAVIGTNPVTVQINLNQGQSPLEVDSLAGGTLVYTPFATAISLIIDSNTANSVTIRRTGGGKNVTVQNTGQFIAYDDDDFNNNDGTNPDGDTGEDILGPDQISPSGTALLTAGSDSTTTNVLAAAYVRPVYDIADTRDDCLFQANTLGEDATVLRPLFTGCWDSSATNISPTFWSMLLLGAYQHTENDDGDPSTDGLSQGIVDEITDVTGDMEGSGALIFMEVHRTREIPTYNSNPMDVTSLANTVAHEVGHLFSSIHGDGEMMGIVQPDGSVVITSSRFSSLSIRRIRRITKP